MKREKEHETIKTSTIRNKVRVFTDKDTEEEIYYTNFRSARFDVLKEDMERIWKKKRFKKYE